MIKKVLDKYNLSCRQIRATLLILSTTARLSFLISCYRQAVAMIE